MGNIKLTDEMEAKIIERNSLSSDIIYLQALNFIKLKNVDEADVYDTDKISAYITELQSQLDAVMLFIAENIGKSII